MLVIAALVILLAFVYYQYTVNKIPAKVAQSQEKIINIDSLRFTFKVSLMAQKALATYLNAVRSSNEALMYEAIDYFDAAIAFTDIAYTNNRAIEKSTRQQLSAIVPLIDKHKLKPPQEVIQQITAVVVAVSEEAEQVERQTWHNIQASYIEFKTQEYELVQLHETLNITFVLFLLITFWLTFRQNNLLKLNRFQQSELSRLAYYDPLTEIANRKSIEASLQTKIKHCFRTGQTFYIALIDVDDFKNVNDLMGHDAGDELLKLCVNHIRAVLREEDVLGRLGGDEFLIVFNEETSESELSKVIARIQNAFNRPNMIAGTEFKVTVSIGVASYPQDVHDGEDNVMQHLIKSADIAMYQAKELGKDQFHFYDQLLEAQLRHEHEMDKEIERALQKQEFELYFQPQFDARSQKIVGAESLVRWDHPQKGWVLPIEFIKLIEKGYHTTQFGEWVIRTVITQQKQWLEKGWDIQLSINLAVKHITSVNFFERIIKLVQEMDADLSRLVFEITEYELIKSNYPDTIQNLRDLQKMGFRFALDDFGTGYSSISYLSELPIEIIKIDKSFIDYVATDQGKKQLVDAVIHIGLTLDKTLVAEGVETEYQVDYLRQAGCHMLQGFYYSKPLAVANFESFYLQRKPES